MINPVKGWVPAGRQPTQSAEGWWSDALAWRDPSDAGAADRTKAIAVWVDPTQSDLPAPTAADAAAYGTRLLYAEQADIDKASFAGVFPPNDQYVTNPATGVRVDGAAAAKTIVNGKQMVRVAVLWSATEDRDTRRPVTDQISEYLLDGSPGAWQVKWCWLLGDGACRRAVD
jgi:hypothetical protein